MLVTKLKEQKTNGALVHTKEIKSNTFVWKLPMERDYLVVPDTDEKGI